MADEDDVGSESDAVHPDLYAFDFEDLHVVESLRDAVRVLLRRPSLTPHQVVHLGHFLFALGRLPAVTPNFNMAVALKTRSGEELSWYEARIDCDCVQLNSGGSVYDPRVGSDTYYRVAFEAGRGWREESGDGAFGWLEFFEEAIADESFQLSIEDDSEGFEFPAEARVAKVDYWALLDAEDDEGV